MSSNILKLKQPVQLVASIKSNRIKGMFENIKMLTLCAGFYSILI